ncbi:hypothetical protein L249_5754 [Ophiocordyceps polyrhachis-furcata BCC 54312]|uniref:Mannosyl-oligosaccharide glucosidase n=1 Tax=Ophiocordyceps polyrhachis-furcata BCC 54312 TaxID=1330021 RepID=A0A367KZQ7_9HYPO|nr:hypothetical protein L249_5754 [Ophiocordyceps polyrhachis-furcata BCC 54312]
MAKLTGLALLLTAAASTLVGASGDESVLMAEIGRLNNQSLFWGPYKPNLYFGLRPRTPKALWSGLMWGRVEAFDDIKDGFRYTCEQGSDIHGYGWDEYDARTGGVQTIHDEGNNIDLTTSFVKVPGGGHGGSWAARIQGTPRAGAPDKLKTTVIYYLAQEGDGHVEPVKGQDESSAAGFKGDVLFRGSSKALGAYTVRITEGQGDHPTGDERAGDTTVVNSQQLPEDMLWQAKSVVFQLLQKSAAEVMKDVDDDETSPPPPPPWQVFRIQHKPDKGNVHVVQKTFEGPFEFDVLFSSASAGAELTSEEATGEMGRTSTAFAERFGRVFELKAPFTGAEYVKFGKSMLSNLIGGIGYFYGEQLVDRSYAAEYEEVDEDFWLETAKARARGAQKLEGPYELFTSIPSRPFFPRGFLWDEGYHLLLIADWDLDLALEIVRSWFGTMDEDGWIPREQILGPEARSKVPEEFQVQYPHYANPPTLFMVVDRLVDRLLPAGRNGSNVGGDEGGSGILEQQQEQQEQQQLLLYTAHERQREMGWDYLRRLYPLLRRQYDWFRKTQSGDVKSYDRSSRMEAYRWRGRSEKHCLTSGLDDYPRAQPPHPGELHVDLLSWVGMMTKTLMRLADGLGMAEETEELGGRLEGILANLESLHWSEAEGCFCDATVDDFEEHKLVCHAGYVSLLPLLVGLIGEGNDDDRVGRTLDLMADEGRLWSRYGLRSLSRADSLYGSEENYWRGPVWMPVNYMAVTQLRSIATGNGPFRDKARGLYNELRRNLVRTVYESWQGTGFAWEQYSPETGEGQRTRHFTGWTSLVLKLMTMEEV